MRYTISKIDHRSKEEEKKKDGKTAKISDHPLKHGKDVSHTDPSARKSKESTTKSVKADVPKTDSRQRKAARAANDQKTRKDEKRRRNGRQDTSASEHQAKSDRRSGGRPDDHRPEHTASSKKDPFLHAGQ